MAGQRLPFRGRRSYMDRSYMDLSTGTTTLTLHQVLHLQRRAGHDRPGSGAVRGGSWVRRGYPGQRRQVSRVLAERMLSVTSAAKSRYFGLHPPPCEVFGDRLHPPV